MMKYKLKKIYNHIYDNIIRIDHIFYSYRYPKRPNLIKYIIYFSYLLYRIWSDYSSNHIFILDFGIHIYVDLDSFYIFISILIYRIKKIKKKSLEP